MFSIMTMASSTTNPVAMVSAIRVRLLSEKFSRYMTAKVPTSDRGTATLAMKVAWGLRRKTKITATTSRTDSSSSNSTSCTEARMPVVRSVTTVTLIPAGRPAVSPGRAFWIWSTVVMTLAPGWRWTFSTMAGVVL